MAQDRLNLRIAYTRGVKKSVDRIVKTDVTNLSLWSPCSDQARDGKGENDTQHREGQGERGTLVAVCLRQDIARPNVEQEASKEAEVVRQSNGGNREEHGGDGAGHGR